eukprot:6275812-Alexandrium_andersonii.AAC.1
MPTVCPTWVTRLVCILPLGLPDISDSRLRCTGGACRGVRGAVPPPVRLLAPEAPVGGSKRRSPSLS